MQENNFKKKKNKETKKLQFKNTITSINIRNCASVFNITNYLKDKIINNYSL